MEDNQTPVTEETVTSEAPKTKNPADLKLNYPQTLKVGLGFAVVMIFWTVYNFVVPLLLEQAFGFSNTIRNVIVGIASAMCMVLLPVFGKISDKSGKSKLGRKFGRRTPFIVIGTLITIVAMILVPISVSNQLSSSNVIRTEYHQFFQEESGLIPIANPEDGGMITRKELLAKWYDEAESGNYSHIGKTDFEKLKEEHPVATKAFYIGLYDVQISNGKMMGVIGSAKYTQSVVVFDALKGEYVTKDAAEITESDYESLNKIATAWAQYVDDTANDFVSAAVNKEVNWGYFVFFLIALVLIILAQTVIRTPAVSLMPDVTPSPLRSPGNAMINLVGGVGGGIGFLIYTITFMFADKISLSTQYWIIFGTMAGALALVLGLFILLVREKKMVENCNKICLEYGLPVYEEKEEKKEEKKPKVGMFKQYGAKKMTSFLLILGAIFMWFIGYYAIANNMPIYCVKILGVSTGLASIVSGASLVVAAIGFIPVGIMGRKIGRRWSVIFGFSLAIISYLLVAICVNKASDTATIIFMACYMVSGFGLIFANVNTLPMVLEVSSPEDIGKFTGIYYIATMSAQTLGPIFGGLVMDYIGGSKALFIFSAICVAIGAVMMLFVKHGEAPDYVAKVAAKKSKANV
ncbi:MAG: MFS transporter [Clostridia bacterium]|nr:MFS transporter [Clostridia bacterium]